MLPDTFLSPQVSDVPAQPLALNYNNSGFLPHVGLHRRGSLFYQESSHSHFWLAGSMFVAALIVTFLPWNTPALHGIKLKFFVAGIGIWGGICAGVPYFIRNKLGQTILINPKAKTVSIQSNERNETVEWNQIIGLQICHEKVERNSEMTGYQLNLVWRDHNGAVKRHCLLKHVSRSFVISFGKRYERHFQFHFL